jgi:hypothetical protein
MVLKNSLASDFITNAIFGLPGTEDVGDFWHPTHKSEAPKKAAANNQRLALVVRGPKPRNWNRFVRTGLGTFPKHTHTSTTKPNGFRGPELEARAARNRPMTPLG